MFYCPKSFTLISILTNQEVFTNVAWFALHLFRENKRTIIPENLIDVGLVFRIDQLAQYVIIIVFIITSVLCTCCVVCIIFGSLRNC